MQRHAWHLRLVLALVVYGACVWGEHYGLHSTVHGGDVDEYVRVAHAVAHGALPYRDVDFEYPPGALVPLLLAQPASDYFTAFKVVMAILGAVSLGIAAVVLATVHTRPPLGPLLAIAVAPLVLGSVYVNRFDVWPALLLVAALALLVRGHALPAAAALAAGTLTKIFPAAALPVVLVWLLRTRGPGLARRALAAFAVATCLLLLPFVVTGPGGLAHSFNAQATRHLQVESLGGSLLLVADKLGLYHAAPTTVGRLQSLDLLGALPDAIGTTSLVLAVSLIVAAALALARGRLDPERLVLAVAASIAIYVAFGKVLSPQYLVWLVPLVPLVRGRVGVAATGLLLTLLALTQIEFDHGYGNLARVGPVVWVLALRNALLLTLAVLLLVSTRPTADRSA